MTTHTITLEMDISGRPALLLSKALILCAVLLEGAPPRHCAPDEAAEMRDMARLILLDDYEEFAAQFQPTGRWGDDDDETAAAAIN